MIHAFLLILLMKLNTAHYTMKKILTVLMSLLMMMHLTAKKNETNFLISNNGKVAPIVVYSTDWKGVYRAANDLADDIGKVTGTKSTVFTNTPKK